MFIRTLERLLPGSRYTVRGVEHVFPPLEIAEGSRLYLTRRRILDELCEMLAFVDRHLRSRGIEYYASHGTLLGAVRHQGMIPWDDDADLFLLGEVTPATLLADAKPFVDAGFRLIPSGSNIKLAKARRGVPFPYVDLQFGGPEMPASVLRPLRRMPFEDFEVTVPAQPEQALGCFFADGCLDRAVFDVPLPWINSHWFDMALLQVLGPRRKKQLDTWSRAQKNRLGWETCR